MKFDDTKRLPQDLTKVKSEFFRTVSTMVISAVGLVAALAWNTTSEKILSRYIDTSNASIFTWLIYAVIVTLFAVLVTIFMGRLAEQHGNRIELAKDQKKVEA